MKCTTIISGVAFAVVFLTAAFLFMRNYPSDRWFSVVFVVAGGVLAWCARGEGAVSNPNVEKDTETMTSTVEEKKENI
jgi:hypothetical protein